MNLDSYAKFEYMSYTSSVPKYKGKWVKESSFIWSFL